MKSDLEAALN